jgi:hypothetical protein
MRSAGTGSRRSRNRVASSAAARMPIHSSGQLYRVPRQGRARQHVHDRLPRGRQIALAERDQRVDVAHRLGELDIVGGADGPARVPQLTRGIVVAAAQRACHGAGGPG